LDDYDVPVARVRKGGMAVRRFGDLDQDLTLIIGSINEELGVPMQGQTLLEQAKKVRDYCTPLLCEQWSTDRWQDSDLVTPYDIALATRKSHRTIEKQLHAWRNQGGSSASKELGGVKDNHVYHWGDIKDVVLTRRLPDDLRLPETVNNE